MEEIIRVHDQHYILATSARVDDRTRILKHNETFGVFDRAGNVQHFGLGEQGLYFEDTRYLSRLDILLAHRRPILLNSTAQAQTAVLAVDFTNPDIPYNGEVLLPRDTVHLFRYSFLWNAAYYSRFRVRSFHPASLTLDFAIRFESDFADVFEVRGTRRAKRGTVREPTVSASRVVLSYEGLDGDIRGTSLEFSPAPQELTGSTAHFQVTLERGEEKLFFLTVRCEPPACAPGAATPFHAASEAATAHWRHAALDHASVETSDDHFNRWINRSSADLQMMTTETGTGPYPHAGVPWFSTVFGRDGLITALEYLAFQPQIARGVLAYLAQHQARETNTAQDAEPGKILHEVRHGEMARLGEVPFGSYYGSVDATPLFVLLCGAYYERTADKEFVHSIWQSVEAALTWIDRHGDADGDGFVEYLCQSPHGLVTQGWKDSFDSVFHCNGALAQPPIAFCEVQAYVYAARHHAARLAEVIGLPARAALLREQAKNLRDQFDEVFWCEEISTFAEALDREKRPCCVKTSNPGQCLFTGIVKPHRISPLVATLMHEDSFSGWGVRTVARGECRYNPMSYHNGSIWPHDNALIAAGLAQCGHKQEALKILNALYDASKHVELNRIPELLCGFDRRDGEGPTQYPVACAPQAWSAGAVFLLLQSCLGLTIDAPARQIRIVASAMPPYLKWITMKNIRLPDASVDLHFRRDDDEVVVGVPRKKGSVEIIVYK